MVDASAIAAILLDEAGAFALTTRLDGVPSHVTHPVSVFEAALAFSRVKGVDLDAAHREVAGFLAASSIAVVPISELEAAAALDAHARYGRGRGHPARLNMGDCFSYACARLRGLPLLYEGDEFARTDLA